MAKTIKINDETKRRIEELQAKILIYQKRKINQQEILEKLLDFSLANSKIIFGLLEELELKREDYAWKMLNRPLKWGIKDASINIDKHLYG
ncbi:MAG: hypothetical protein ACTSRG_17060 [Candidatus Helarchaeota archaeon]